MIYPTLKHDVIMQRMRSRLKCCDRKADEEIYDFLTYRPEERTLYDARGIPFDFLVETGAEYLAELDDRSNLFDLSSDWHANSYFEFDCGGVFVEAVDHHHGGTFGDDSSPLPDDLLNDPSVDVTDLGDGLLYAVEQEVIIRRFSFYYIPFIDGDWFANLNKSMELEPPGLYALEGFQGPDGVAPDRAVLSPVSFSHIDDDEAAPEDPEFDRQQRLAALAVLGITCLLEERLTTHQSISFPDVERINARRVAKGKKPILRSNYTILRLNISEVRRRATANPLRRHESPRLHWRRGHWRTIHRYSIDERKVWVRKCLVGDPDRGMLEKHYLVVNSQNFR